MADDRSKKDADKFSPLERYLAKQKADKLAQAAKEAPTQESRLARLAKKAAAAPTAKDSSPKDLQPKAPTLSSTKSAKSIAAAAASERPTLHGIERPQPLQPPSLSRWEAVADDRLTETEERAREAGAPPVPPAVSLSTSQSPPIPPPLPEDRYQPLTDRPLMADGRVNADFGPRFVALLIDCTILTMIGAVANRVVLAVLAIAFGAAADLHRDGLTDLVYLGLLYAYYGYFYSTKGSSPGKLILGLEVTDVDGQTRLTPWKAFLREAIGKPISAIPFFMGYIIVLIRLDHRALHDLLFDTRVVRKGRA